MWSCPRFLNIPQGNPPPFPLPPVPPIPGEGYPVRIPGKQTGDRWELLLHVEKHAECRKRNVWTTFWKPGNQQVFILCSTIIELSNHGTRCLSFFSRVLVEYADETPCLVTAGQWWPDVYFCVWRRLLAECCLNDGTQTFGPHCCSTFRTFLVYQRSKIKCNNEFSRSKLKTKIFIWVQDVRRVDEAESTVGSSSTVYTRAMQAIRILGRGRTWRNNGVVATGMFEKFYVSWTLYVYIVPHFGLWKGTPCECLGSCSNL